MIAPSPRRSPTRSRPTWPGRSQPLNSLAALGRREAALQAIEEAVRLYRALAEARPDAFTPNLAMSLSNLSNSLGALSRREAALQAIEEAVQLHGALAEARPDAFTPNLAMSLSNLSNSLGALGRREAALQAIEEAVRLYRALAEAQPDAFTSDLTSSLSNLSNSLGDLGQREAALQAIEEAVRLHRTLAEARPDAFNPNLAMSLSNLSNSLGALGRREAALQAVEEAVRLYRALAEARPDAFNSDLARSLNSLSSRLGALGRLEAALQAIEEAARLYRALAEAWPDAFTPDLAMSLSNFSNKLGALGGARRHCRRSRRRPGSIAPWPRHGPTRSRPIWRARSTTSPTASTPWAGARRRCKQSRGAPALSRPAEVRPDALTPDLAEAANSLSNRLGDLGRREAALQAIEEAVRFRRTLAEAQPDAFTPDWPAHSTTFPTASPPWAGARRRCKQSRRQSGSSHPCRSAARRVHARLGQLAQQSLQQPRRPGRPEAALQAVEEAVRPIAPSPRRSPTRSRPTWPGRSTTSPTASPPWAGARRRCRRSRRRSGSAAPSPRHGPTRSHRTWPTPSTTFPTASAPWAGARRLLAIEEAVRLHRALAEARPDAFTPDLANSLSNLSNSLGALGRREAALQAIEEAVRLYRAPRRGAARRVHTRLGQLAQQPFQQPRRLGPARGGAAGDRGGGPALSRPRRSTARRVHAQPGHLAQQLLQQALRPGPARGGTAGDRGGGPAPPHPRRGTARRVHARLGHVTQQLLQQARRSGPTRGGAGARSRRRSTCIAPWPRHGPTRSRPTWPGRFCALGNLHTEARSQDLAHPALREGVERLAPVFLSYPATDTDMMAGLVQSYVSCCKVLGRDLYMVLLAPMLHMFHQLQSKG